MTRVGERRGRCQTAGVPRQRCREKNGWDQRYTQQRERASHPADHERYGNRPVEPSFRLTESQNLRVDSRGVLASGQIERSWFRWRFCCRRPDLRRSSNLNGLCLPHWGGIRSDLRGKLNLCRRNALNLCRGSMLGFYRFDIHENGVLVSVVRTHAGRQDPMAQTAIVFLHAPPW